uniref:Uncharacterized protein n=1 Tax=Romanomermis culicivorax TaxID=13658 RepID=A0A915LDR6_ROMCU
MLRTAVVREISQYFDRRHFTTLRRAPDYALCRFSDNSSENPAPCAGMSPITFSHRLNEPIYYQSISAVWAFPAWIFYTIPVYYPWKIPAFRVRLTDHAQDPKTTLIFNPLMRQFYYHTVITQRRNRLPHAIYIGVRLPKFHFCFDDVANAQRASANGASGSVEQLDRIFAIFSLHLIARNKRFDACFDIFDDMSFGNGDKIVQRNHRINGQR